MTADQTNGHERKGGRFTAGNPGGPGNPHAKAVSRLRSAMLAAVTEEDIHAICSKLVDMAKCGNVMAAREVLDRCLGRSLDPEKIVELPTSDVLRQARKVPEYTPNGPF